MQDSGPLYAAFFSSAASLTEPERSRAQLAWLAEFCGATRVMLAVRTDGETLGVGLDWPNPSPCTQMAEWTEITLGPVTGGVAVLLLNGAAPTLAMTQAVQALGPALGMILDLQIARTAQFPTDLRRIPALAHPIGDGNPEDAAPVQLIHSPASAGRRLGALLTTQSDLLFEITPQGRCTDFLAGPSDLLGEARTLAPGLSLEQVLPPEIADAMRRDLDLALRTGHSPPTRYPLGSRWYERSGVRNPPRGAIDTATVIFVVRDVTDDALQTDDARHLGKIVETMSNMVVIVDTELGITWVNRAWEKRTGRALADVRGQNLPHLVRAADDTSENVARVRAAIEKGEAYTGEAFNVDALGNQYWVNFNIFPLHNPEGHCTGYVSVETDITAQKQGELQVAELAEEARLTRLRLTNAIEALPDGVIIWDEQERLVVANSAYSRMYPEIANALVKGVSQDHILSIGIAVKAFPDAIGREEAWLAEQYSRYQNQNVDEIFRSDGRWIRRVDLRTADGGRVAVRIDTTERRYQLAALDTANLLVAQAQKSLAQIIESANVGTWDWRPDAGKHSIGGQYAHMLGYTVDEISGTWQSAFGNLVHPDDLTLLLAKDAKDAAVPPAGAEPVHEHQFRMRRKDGEWAWILSRSAVTERFADGRYKRLVGIHLDVTELRQLADEVAASRTFLTEVMDASIAAIVVMDQTGMINYANVEAERILGLTRSEIKKRRYDDPVWSITAPDGSAMPYSELPFRRAIASGAPVRGARMAIALPDGTRRILSVNAAPHSETGTADAGSLIVTSFVDITDDLGKEVQLEQMLEMAQAASRAKSVFLENMSHEIRTPLNGVLGMAELLEAQITEPGKKVMIGTIRQSGELLMNVLNEILDMSKIEAGKMAIEKIAFVPDQIVRQIEPLHSLRAQEKGLDLQVLIDAGSRRSRLGDPFRIQQILNNLLSNAIKFTERGSVVLSLFSLEDDHLVFEVRDSGIGMTPEQVTRMFNNFEQAEVGTTRRFGGSGLGMAIVRGLTEMMGGQITVNSTLDSGTCVRVQLPATAAPTSVPPPPPRSAAATLSLAGVRLLAADDSATNRLVLSEMLKSSGATIMLATNGAEAVAEWQRLANAGTPADVLLLDIAMPVLDGIGALTSIRAQGGAGCRVPALAITANAMAHQVAEYEAAGFDAHLSKPFRQEDLLRAITTLLRHP